METPNEANIPGAAGVIRVHGGNAFYCTVCKTEIQPLLIEVDEGEVPCCENCALEDIIAAGGDIKSAISTGESSEQQLQDAEDSLWDGCCT
jgi:hypothetical protein